MMLLVTTKDKRFWGNEKDVVCLGAWCMTAQEVLKGEKKVLDYHWHDKNRYFKDVEYLNALYESILNDLAKSLNKINSENKSRRYWELILGQWLRVTLDATYDRYLSIKAADKCSLVTSTIVSSSEPTFPRWPVSYGHDAYNMYIFSRLIKEVTDISWEEVGLESCPEKKETNSQDGFRWVSIVLSFFRRQAKKNFRMLLAQSFEYMAVYVWPKLAMKVSGKVVFCGSMYIPFKDFFLMNVGLGQVPYLYQGKRTYLRHVDPELGRRNEICIEKTNEYEAFLEGFIRDEIPMIFVENYSEMKKVSLNAWPRKPEKIITTLSVNHNYSYLFWAANCAENFNTKLLVSQHGGGFGVLRFSAIEIYLLNVYDKYYTWGATFDGADKVKPMPSFRLQNSAAKIGKNEYAKNGYILFLAASWPRYLILSDSNSQGSRVGSYYKNCVLFLKLISNNNSRTVWRYTGDHWDEAHLIEHSFPDVEIQFGEKKQLGRESTFYSAVSKSKVTVHTVNETTFLETLAANHPTLAFWDSESNLIKPSMEATYRILLDVGIVHYSPESCAEKLNAIQDDPSIWWFSESVQKAREEFCAVLAKTDPNYIAEWVNELRQ